MSNKPRTWVEISAGAVRHNVQTLRHEVGDVPLLAVIKANAYGHDMVAMARLLSREKVWGFGVAYGAEALALRRAGVKKKIAALSYWRPTDLPELVRSNIDVVVWDQPSLLKILRLPPNLRRRARVHLKVDTGTARIGFVPHKVVPALLALAKKDVQVVAIFSHLSSSEERSRSFTEKQINRFATLKEDIAGAEGTLWHIASTAAAFRYPEARFGLIRAGIGLYGLWPSPETKQSVNGKISLKPVLAWKTTISQLKVLPAKTPIGYGRTWVTPRQSLIATLPVGYSDGYNRRRSNIAWVMVKGKRALVVGRVAMNLMMVDVTGIKGLKVGDPVTLLGPGVSAETLAAVDQTINYEVITEINPQIPRLVVA